MSKPEEVGQMRMIPFVCGFVGCQKDAVCGLQSISNPRSKVNVCAAHFNEMMGKNYVAANPKVEGR